MEKDLLQKFIYESTNVFISKEIRKIIVEREQNLSVAPVLFANPNDPPKDANLNQIDKEKFKEFYLTGQMIQKDFLHFETV